MIGYGRYIIRLPIRKRQNGLDCSFSEASDRLSGVNSRLSALRLFLFGSVTLPFRKLALNLYQRRAENTFSHRRERTIPKTRLTKRAKSVHLLGIHKAACWIPSPALSTYGNAGRGVRGEKGGENGPN